MAKLETIRQEGIYYIDPVIKIPDYASADWLLSKIIKKHKLRGEHFQGLKSARIRGSGQMNAPTIHRALDEKLLFWDFMEDEAGHSFEVRRRMSHGFSSSSDEKGLPRTHPKMDEIRADFAKDGFHGNAACFFQYVLTNGGEARCLLPKEKEPFFRLFAKQKPEAYLLEWSYEVLSLMPEKAFGGRPEQYVAFRRIPKE